MIYLTNKLENKFGLTLQERTETKNPFFLFEFKNAFNNIKTFYNTLSDLSNERYDLFTLDLSSFTMSGGQYTYNVYESATSSLSLTYSTKFLETGRMYIND